MSSEGKLSHLVNADIIIIIIIIIIIMCTD
jgi:hypothetical protein